MQLSAEIQGLKQNLVDRQSKLTARERELAQKENELIIELINKQSL